MKSLGITTAVISGLLAPASLCYAGVTYSTDVTTTTGSTAWPGSPAISLATPSQGNVYEGAGPGAVVGIAFLATSSFNLAAVEFQATGGPANVSLSLYDLGTTVSASNPRYTIGGGSVNLLTPGLNFNFAGATDTFGVLTFDGADQVALTSGNWYSLEFLNNDAANTVLLRRASTALDAFLAQGASATGDRNNVPAGDRDPVAAIYAVPEPSTFALLGVGALAAVFIIRRRVS